MNDPIEHPPARGVYRHAQLGRLIAPRSVAIVGASPTAGSFGQRTLANLSGFDGRIHLVNARYPAIGERPCHPDVDSLPEVPDCAVLTIARDAVEAVVLACARAGVGGVIVYASGYSETGRPERIRLQARLGDIASETGLRIIGPNCIGIVNARCGASMTFSNLPAFRPWSPDAIGLISQSGALGFALAQAAEHGMPFSHVLTAGNSCDVDVADQVSYLAGDPDCRAIACVFEGMPAPERLIEAGRIAWAADKPLVIYKLATGEHGAAAAMSHTGSLAGSDAAYRAAFERAGIVVVEQFESLLETARFLAKAPPPRAAGVAVVATSGGAAIMAADKSEVYGLPLPQPGPHARSVLEARIPEFGSPRNPCDVTGQVLNDPESLSACAGALLADDAFGALLVPQVYSWPMTAQRVSTFDELSARHDKITCLVWLCEWLEGPGAVEAEQAPRVALFRSMDRCFAALAAWQARALRRALETGADAGDASRIAPAAAAASAAALIDAAGSDTLTERESKQVLAAYGIPVVGERLAGNEDAAVAAAAGLGYPVAIKVESPDLPHKTEAGVIRLDLRSEADVRRAWREVTANAARVQPAPRVNGVLVQPMIPAGVEVMLGARIDPLFGPLVVVGLGGVLVEILRDTRVALAPVDVRQAHSMLRALRGAALFDGFRGAPPVDLDALAGLVSRFSAFVHDQRDRIAEVDVNPLICAPGRIVAVDALIRRRATQR